MEGLRIAPIGKGPLAPIPRRPTLTNENIENVWEINTNKLLESTKENIRLYGPEAILTGNLRWANKPSTNGNRTPMQPIRARRPNAPRKLGPQPVTPPTPPNRYRTPLKRKAVFTEPPPVPRKRPFTTRKNRRTSRRALRKSRRCM
jgi:hypothetical protein